MQNCVRNLIAKIFYTYPNLWRHCSYRHLVSSSNLYLPTYDVKIPYWREQTKSVFRRSFSLNKGVVCTHMDFIKLGFFSSTTPHSSQTSSVTPYSSCFRPVFIANIRCKISSASACFPWDIRNFGLSGSRYTKKAKMTHGKLYAIINKRHGLKST